MLADDAETDQLVPQCSVPVQVVEEASGCIQKKRKDSLTYTDGDNSVTVKSLTFGVLNFSNGGSDNYCDFHLLSHCAIHSAEKLEGSGAGMPASL